MQDDCLYCKEVFTISPENTVLVIYGLVLHMSRWHMTCPFCGGVYSIFVGDLGEEVKTANSLELEIKRFSIPMERIIDLYRDMYGIKARQLTLAPDALNRIHAFADQLRDDKTIRKEIKKWTKESD